MKERKRGMEKKKMRKRMIISMLLTLLMLGLWGNQTEAAAKNSKIMKTYSKFLSKKNISWQHYGKNVKIPSSEMNFGYMDMKSHPMMVLEDEFWSGCTGSIRLFTYKKGKIKRIEGWRSSRDQMIDSYYPAKGVFKTIYGYPRIEGYYQYDGQEIREIAVKEWLSEGGPEYIAYFWKGKQVSKKTYKDSIKKYLGKAKCKKLKTYRNTKRHRAAYLTPPTYTKKNWYLKVLNTGSGKYKVKTLSDEQYKKFTKETVDVSDFCSYYLRDFNGDGVKELLLTTYNVKEEDSNAGKTLRYLLLTYHNGKIKPLLQCKTWRRVEYKKNILHFDFMRFDTVELKMEKGDVKIKNVCIFKRSRKDLGVWHCYKNGKRISNKEKKKFYKNFKEIKLQDLKAI